MNQRIKILEEKQNVIEGVLTGIMISVGFMGLAMAVLPIFL